MRRLFGGKQADVHREATFTFGEKTVSPLPPLLSCWFSAGNEGITPVKQIPYGFLSGNPQNPFIPKTLGHSLSTSKLCCLLFGRLPTVWSISKTPSYRAHQCKWELVWAHRLSWCPVFLWFLKGHRRGKPQFWAGP